MIGFYLDVHTGSSDILLAVLYLQTEHVLWSFVHMPITILLFPVPFSSEPHTSGAGSFIGESCSTCGSLLPARAVIDSLTGRSNKSEYSSLEIFASFSALAVIASVTGRPTFSPYSSLGQ